MRIGVFCGSSGGVASTYVEAAETMGRAIAEAGCHLVYGGASVGLMGVVADAALAAGAEVTGVIPGGLWADEIAHTGLTELRVVDSLAERKRVMAELSDVFVALPGGYGTLDELFEMVTWNQLALHEKPCALLDVEGFWADLVAFLGRAMANGFIKEIPLVGSNPRQLLAQLGC